MLTLNIQRSVSEVSSRCGHGCPPLTSSLRLSLRLCCRFTSCLSFYSILNELSDYAGQREVVAEEMAHKVYGELMGYSQELKAERKNVSRPNNADLERFGSLAENFRLSVF